MATVDLENIRKRYGGMEVLHGISLDISDGEFVILVGPSGCGKSTLLRMIAGLEDVSDGDIRIGERLVNNLAPKQRDIAMVFQNYALYPHMSVRENMGFSMRLARAKKPDKDAAVEKAAGILGLTDYLDRYPRELSGGQRQRVAMGRAIVRDPQVFLFDEPLSNLDAKLRVEMRTEIKSLHQRLGTTTIYVTHDQIEAMTMADKVVVLNGGNIEQAGSPLEIYDEPANLFVAGFIGSPSMNMIEGVVEREDGRLLLRGAGGHAWPLPPETTPDLEDRSVTYGIRPEHLIVAGDDDVGALHAEISVVEPTGSETQVFMQLGGETLVGLFRERISKQPGETIALRPDAERIYLFDTASGERL